MPIIYVSDRYFNIIKSSGIRYREYKDNTIINSFEENIKELEKSLYELKNKLQDYEKILKERDEYLKRDLIEEFKKFSSISCFINNRFYYPEKHHYSVYYIKLTNDEKYKDIKSDLKKIYDHLYADSVCSYTIHYQHKSALYLCCIIQTEVFNKLIDNKLFHKFLKELLFVDKNVIKQIIIPDWFNRLNQLQSYDYIIKHILNQ